LRFIKDIILRVFLFAVILSAFTQTSAQLIALDTESAGPDFKIQGEYLGHITLSDGTRENMAAQVIALGEGSFRAVLYSGGLPGDGWDNTTPAEISGQLQDDEAVFSADVYEAIIASDTLSGQNSSQEEFELVKIFRTSPTLDAPPPQNAIILFDGTDVDEWTNAGMDERGFLSAEAVSDNTNTRGPTTKRDFQSFTLHMEFILPFKPYGQGQDRGNSGLFMNTRHEVQILDSFGSTVWETDDCGGIYRQFPPDVQMCLPPLSWQTYACSTMVLGYISSEK
jgi:hypothetical protein